MMKSNLFLYLMMCFSISVAAQKDYKNETLQLKTRVFTTSIITSGSNRNISGYFANLPDLNLYHSSSTLNCGRHYAEREKMSKTRFVIGLSAPELLHAGITYRIANISQFGLSAGIGPTMGGVWPALNLEHRLYLGKNSEETNQKTWFFRQGTTFFPSAESPQQFTLNLTVGKDVIFKNIKSGITIDAGVFYLPESETSSIILVKSLNLWPALRFEFYFSL